MAKVVQNRQKHTCKVCSKKSGMFHAFKSGSRKAGAKRLGCRSYNVSETETCSGRKKERSIAASCVTAEHSTDNVDKDVKEKIESCHSDVKRNLTEDEKAKVSDLEKAFLERYYKSSSEYSVENLSESYGLFNLGSTSVRKLVSFIKSVEEFKSLPIETQTACLKEHMCSCLVWIAISNYDVGSETIYFQGSLPLHVDFLRQVFQNHLNTVDMFIELCKSIAGKINIDTSIQAIFLCILVFNPAGEGLINRRHLSNVQDTYMILLKHYFESKYTYGESKKFFAYLLSKLKDIRLTDDRFNEIAQQIPVEKIEPLMREIFQV